MNVKQICDDLVKRGAVLNLRDTNLNVLIDYWEWIDAYTVFYFEAGTTDEFGGHLLKFGRAWAQSAEGVFFYDENAHRRPIMDPGLVAYLTTIAEAVENPRETQLVLDTWRRESAAQMAPFIQEVKANLLS